jgi:hypothetical protein
VRKVSTDHHDRHAEDQKTAGEAFFRAHAGSTACIPRWNPLVRSWSAE